MLKSKLDNKDLNQLKAVNISELLQFKFKPHEHILEPWLTTQSVNIITGCNATCFYL